MKTQLTAEESAKLVELGVNASQASEKEKIYVSQQSRDTALMYQVFYHYASIFTLADIIDILPKEIRHNGCTYKLNIDYPPIGMVAARYNTEEDDLDSLKGYLSEELIDVLYSMLLWCLEKGYMKV